MTAVSGAPEAVGDSPLLAPQPCPDQPERAGPARALFSPTATFPHHHCPPRQPPSLADAQEAMADPANWKFTSLHSDAEVLSYLRDHPRMLVHVNSFIEVRFLGGPLFRHGGAGVVL